MVLGAYISIIILNLNRLSASAKRHRLARWIWKEDPHVCCLQETHLKPRDTYGLKVRGWEEVSTQMVIQRKAGIVAILISDNIDFKTKIVIRDKEGHYKGSIQEEDITIINIYVPNIGTPQYVRQMLRSIRGN